MFPGGSKSRVNKAGNNVREGTATQDDIAVIEEWRAAHRAVLNTFQASLRTRTRYLDVTVAQRHKRRKTIFDKLDRYKRMNLVRMDDVAGCRLIFQNLDDLYKFRNSFLKAKFLHKRRNDIDRYDYIKNPKSTGYRGVHDVYEYDVRSATNRHLTGLYLEIQYRTLVQHSWATAVEVVGFVTQNQPKFERGDKRYQEALVYASEILARSYENHTGALPELSNEEIVHRFLRFDEELHLIHMLKGLNAFDKSHSDKRNTILAISESDELDVYEFRDATDALRMLFQLEKDFPEKDIVLVKADSSDEVRLAFKNYFSDATDFINLVEEGCTKLSNPKMF